MSGSSPVPHALNCLCERCCAARREEAAGRGKVFCLSRPRPGTAEAITAAYMFAKRRPKKADVEREMRRLSAKSRAS